jgi:hypothetical protein
VSPELAARGEPRPAPSTQASKDATPTERPVREIVVAQGEALSGLITRHYGKPDLTLLDFVKSANPDIENIDLLRAGQRIKLPPFEASRLVQKSDGGKYRMHLMTTWDNRDQVIEKLRPAVAKLGRQVTVVPVNMTQHETAYRVLIGEFADRREAEAFYRDFRVPLGVTSQLWR